MQSPVEKVAYSYIRCSSSEQIKGDSIRRQLAHAEAYAAAHGYRLDTTIRDLGRSGYSGDHRTRGALAGFLNRIRTGDIVPGQLLLVEAVDRMGREAPLDAFELITGIVNSGISIITLEDNQVYNRDTLHNNIGLFYTLVGKIHQAHGESERKSVLVGEAWRKKKRLAVSERKPMGKTCPAWMKLSADRTHYVLIENRASIVRRIYRNTIDGLGQEKICRMLNAESIPPFTKEDQGLAGGRTPQGWRGSYVKKILLNRATIGEYQPHLKNTKTNKQQVKVGDPVENYFPPVITHHEWQAAQAAIASRRGTGGRKASRIANLASGICVCASCGGKMMLGTSGIRWKDTEKPRTPDLDRHGDFLVCDNARRNRGCDDTKRFRYAHVERALLAGLIRMQQHEEFSPRNPQEGDFANQIAILEDRIAKDKKRLADVVRTFEDISTVQEVMDELMAEVKMNTAARDALTAKVRETVKVTDSWWHDVNEALKQAGAGEFMVRSRLQAAIRRLYSKVECSAGRGFVIAFAAPFEFRFRLEADGRVQWIEWGAFRSYFAPDDSQGTMGHFTKNGAGQLVDINRDGYLGDLIRRTGMHRAIVRMEHEGVKLLPMGDEPAGCEMEIPTEEMF